MNYRCPVGFHFLGAFQVIKNQHWPLETVSGGFKFKDYRLEKLRVEGQK